jgi:hypothetical protein
MQLGSIGPRTSRTQRSAVRFVLSDESIELFLNLQGLERQFPGDTRGPILIGTEISYEDIFGGLQKIRSCTSVSLGVKAVMPCTSVDDVVIKQTGKRTVLSRSGPIRP